MAQKNRNVDRARAEAAVSELLAALGYDPLSQRFTETPHRVVDALLELTTARDFELSNFINQSDYHQPVLVKDIDFVSVCEHHLLPFRGVAHIGYLPSDTIVGLSGLAYAVEKFAHNLHLQEPLTLEIAEYLHEQLQSEAVAVAIAADHMCLQVRGARAASAKTLTYAFAGTKSSDAGFKAWFYSAVGVQASQEQMAD